MTFTNLDLSKKLHASGCKSVSGQFYSEHQILHRHSPYEECQDQKHEEIFGIPKYCLEDFALNNDHCRENWEKIVSKIKFGFQLNKRVWWDGNKSAIKYLRHGLVDEAEGGWCGCLEDLLKD